MKIMDFFRGAFSAAAAEGIEFDDVATDVTPEAAIAGAIPPDPRVAQLQQQVNEMRSQQRATAAASFALKAVSDHRALPNEQAKLAELHAQAAADDAERPLASGSRVAQLEASVTERPPLALYGEKVPDAALFAMGAKSEPEDKDARKRRLMKMTATGRAALKQEATNAN